MQMRTFHKLLVGIALAGTLSLGLVWGSGATATQAVRAVAEDIQKPGHIMLAEGVMIQKPGH
jgi:hypothetical protein